jgi:peroxiredoxin
MGNRIELNKIAPDFSLTDIDGQEIRLSNFRDKANVLLVFNRGFV